MKYQTYDNGGSIEGLVSISGMNLTGFLSLRGDPVSPLEAATRQYVLTKATAIKASSIVSGVFSKGRMPSFFGAVATVQGNTLMTIQTSGVIAGTYTKVTVNSAGQVVSGSNLLVSDIPPVSWSKITTGKPTTLNGYGITDGVNRNSAVLTLPLILNIAPVDDTDTVSKLYVDQKGTVEDIYNVGDLVKGEYATPPAGFLRCNGAEVSKSAYPYLYQLIGDKFGADLIPGSGKPWTQQYLFNNENITDITNWTNGNPMITGVSAHQAVVTKNRVYLLANRVTGGSMVNTIYSAAINEDGSLGDWNTAGTLPASYSYSKAIITKNRVYLLGGYAGTSAVSAVYTAPINSDGTLGTWSAGTNLPMAGHYSWSFTTKNRVYWGAARTAGDVPTSAVYTAPINTDGTIGTWTTGPSLPVALYAASIVVTKTKVYHIGGTNNSASSSGVYVAPINTDGTIGTWTATNSLPVAIHGAGVVVIKNRVFLIGGGSNSALLSSVYSATINSDDSLGTWSLVSPLPESIGTPETIVVKDKIYILGGVTIAGSYQNIVKIANFAGGSNDYSSYYDGTVLPITNQANFRIPNYTTKENPTGNVFIKY